MKPVDPGSLSERVVFTPRTATTSGGRTTYADGTTDTVWARVRPLSAAERARAGRSDERAAYAITARRPLPSGAVPAASGRVLWRGATLEITGVLVSEDRAYYTVEAVAP